MERAIDKILRDRKYISPVATILRLFCTYLIIMLCCAVGICSS